MPNEMDQGDSSYESSVVEIASENPQQQKLLSTTHAPIGDTLASIVELSNVPSPLGDTLASQRVLSGTPAPAELSDVPSPLGNTLASHRMEDVVIAIRDVDKRRGVCISRVIHTMRDIEPDVYTPQFVSIGPFHRKNKRLQDMERSKKVFLERFKQRSSINLNVLSSFIERSVRELRASYSENIDLDDGELVELILLDGAFIIELFFSLLRDGEKGKDIFAYDSPLSQLAILGTLPLDLVLFENQLPFFVLKKLFDIAFPNNVPTFPELACEFFSKAFDLEKPKHDYDNYVNVKHFTDLIRFLLLQRAPPTTMKRYLWNTSRLLYSAKELQELGVKLKVSKSKSILDIMFSGRVLELPQISVADLVTDAFFRNMVAFEQLHCSSTSYITNYVTLWNLLINTEEDVNVLVDKKVIRSFMPDTEVVRLFRSMGRNAFQAEMLPEYINIFKRLNKFCENPCRQNIGSLRRDYCRTPWQCVASVAGIFLLVLTLLQTIFSILQEVN